MKTKSRWLLAITAFILIAVLAVIWDAHRRADNSLKRHAQELNEHLALRFPEAQGVSEVLGGSIPGNGWESFLASIEALKSLPEKDRNILSSDCVPSTGSCESAHDSLIKRYTPYFSHLRDSCRAEHFAPENRAPLRDPTYHYFLRSVLIEAFQLHSSANHFHRQQEDVRAFDFILMNLGISRRLAGLGFREWTTAQQVEALALRSARDVLNGYAVDLQELKKFRAQVEILFGSRPLFLQGVAAFDFGVRSALVSVARGERQFAELGVRDNSPSWSFLFSNKLAAIAALNEFKAFSREIEALGALPPKASLKALDWELESSTNPLKSFFEISSTELYREVLAIEARWLLFRTALAVCCYDSPNGAPLMTLSELQWTPGPRGFLCPYSNESIRFTPGRVWSLGTDGDDDGGIPEDLDFDHEVADGDGDVVWLVGPSK